MRGGTRNHDQLRTTETGKAMGWVWMRSAEWMEARMMMNYRTGKSEAKRRDWAAGQVAIDTSAIVAGRKHLLDTMGASFDSTFSGGNAQLSNRAPMRGCGRGSRPHQRLYHVKHCSHANGQPLVWVASMALGGPHREGAWWLLGGVRYYRRGGPRQ